MPKSNTDLNEPLIATLGLSGHRHCMRDGALSLGDYMKEGQATPWGAAQTVDELAPGIESVTTASHGGIILDYDHAQQVPVEIVAKSFLHNSMAWEEDCDWCVPFVVFEAELLKHGSEHTKTVIKEKWHTDAFKRHYQV